MSSNARKAILGKTPTYKNDEITGFSISREGNPQNEEETQNSLETASERLDRFCRENSETNQVYETQHFPRATSKRQLIPFSTNSQESTPRNPPSYSGESTPRGESESFAQISNFHFQGENSAFSGVENPHRLSLFDPQGPEPIPADETLLAQYQEAQKTLANYFSRNSGPKTILCPGHRQAPIPHLDLSFASAGRGVGEGPVPSETLVQVA